MTKNNYYVKTCSFKEYIKKYDQIANIINSDLLFKVDPAYNAFNYYICSRGAAAINLDIDNKNIIINGLIGYNGGGGAVLKHIVNNFKNSKYDIILDSFESNNNFYVKHGFKAYKYSKYDPIYDPLKLNKNHEGVIYYYYNKEVII